MEKILNYINGQLLAPMSEKFIENIDPAVGAPFSLVADSDERDIELATQAAKKAFKSWSITPKQERSRLMIKIADIIERDLQFFAEAESKDTGKPVKLAKTVDIPRAVSNLKFFATAIEHFAAESHSMENTAINYTLRSPIGVAGCISPWNLPLYLFTWKIAPAMAAGNTVVAKPSEITPYSAFLLSKACIEAGLPAGVLNIVHGLGAKVGNAITVHPDIKVISFTGGTATGREISRIAAPMFKKLSLELGGKNPNIIFADADYEEMMKTTLLSSFSNQGQICLCGSRILIEESIYEKFKTDFINRVSQLTIGDPNEDVKIGAIVSKQHYDKILSYIALAEEEGGRVLIGGKPMQPDGRCKNGYFIKPTVIEGLGQACRTNTEEIFGPVVTLQTFKNVEEALLLANATEYGLAATVWTSDLKKAHNIAQQIESGIVWINCWLLRDLRTPFGGVKNSGVGREGGFEALKFFTEAKNVCVKL
jgi:aminomuconate-semialdehyde/2-hydroxymuconate-6-semialdehyde dehydrogenase